MIATTDRRAVKMFSAFGGDYVDGNAFGLASWWNDEDNTIASLIEKIDAAYAQGFRRFVIDRPAGQLPDNGNVLSFACWYPMPAWLQEQLLTDFKDYWFSQRASNCTLGIRTGFLLPEHNDVTDACIGAEKSNIGLGSCSKTVKYRVPNLSQREDVDFIRSTLENWLEVGVTEIVLVDPLLPINIIPAVRLASSLWVSGIKMHGSPLPSSSGTVGFSTEAHMIPWLVDWKQIRAAEARGEALTIDAAKTELGVSIEGDNSNRGNPIIALSRQDAVNLNKQGLVIWSSNTDNYDEDIIDVVTAHAGRPPDPISVTAAANGSAGSNTATAQPVQVQSVATLNSKPRFH